MWFGYVIYPTDELQSIMRSANVFNSTVGYLNGTHLAMEFFLTMLLLHKVTAGNSKECADVSIVTSTFTGWE